MKNKLIAFVMTSVLLFCICTSSVSALPSSDLTGYDIYADNASYTLLAQKDTGKIALVIKENGYIWYSNPDSNQDTVAGGELKKRIDSQLVLYYTQGWSEVVTNSVTGCVNRKGLSSTKIADGIKFTYEFKDAGFTVPVQYVLESDGLRAEVLLSEITPEVVTRKESVNGSKEKMDVDYNITKIDFLQYFGAGYADETGYNFVPEGAGGIINFNNGKVNYVSYQAPVYGQYMDQSTMRKQSNGLVRMPVYGMKKGDNAFLAVMEENEGVGFVNSAVSGRETSFNTVYPTIYHKVIDFTAGQNRTQPLSESLAKDGDFSMKYHFLTNDKANYSGMASTYRQYLQQNKGLAKTQSADKPQLYLELFAGVERKTSIAGIVRKVLEPLTTYEDVQTITQEYKEKGIDGLVVKYNDWTKNSERTKVKTNVSYDSQLGGKGDFKDLTKYMSDNKIAFYPSMDFVQYSKSRMGYSNVFDASKSPDQSPAYVRSDLHTEGKYGRRWSMLKPNKVKIASQDFLESYKKTNVGAIALDYIGESSYSDNTKNGVKRSETISIWSDILMQYRDNVGSVLVENANAYAFPYVEHIMDAPDMDYGNELIDENVPFYQMVVHGLISYSSTPINLSADWDKAVLRAIETGADLKYTFVKNKADILKDSYYNELYSCDFDTWFERSLKDYERASSAIEKTKGKIMLSHNKLFEDVYETVYEGGIRTIVNYSGTDVDTVYGKVLANDFIVMKEGGGV